MKIAIAYFIIGGLYFFIGMQYIGTKHDVPDRQAPKSEVSDKAR